MSSFPVWNCHVSVNNLFQTNLLTISIEQSPSWEDNFDHCNIILPSVPRSSKWSLSFWFPHQIPVCTSPVLHVCQMRLPSHSWFDQLSVQSPWIPSHFIPFRPKYLPQYPIRKHTEACNLFYIPTYAHKLYTVVVNPLTWTRCRGKSSSSGRCQYRGMYNFRTLMCKRCTTAAINVIIWLLWLVWYWHILG